MHSPDLCRATLQEWVAVFMRRSMRSLLLYSRERGLSMSQLGALFQIYRQDGCAVSELSEQLGVTRGAVSQLLERLVQQGLILRSEDPADRRVKQLVLTETGAQVIQQGMLARQSWLGELSNSLSPAEQVQVAAALRLLIDKIYQLDTTHTS